MPTLEQIGGRAGRRKMLVKRVAARKIKETWARKKAAGYRGRGRPRKALDDGTARDDFGGLPETDAALDELPESLLG